MTNETIQNSQPNTEANGPNFAIQTIYVKDMSFETPNSPQVFREAWQPEVNLDLNINSTKLEADIHEVTLIITVTAKNNNKTAFLAEIQQAGIFVLQHFAEQQLHHMLSAFCPNILFPFARELVADLVMRGGFPRLYLAPINFDALYEQRYRNAQTQPANETESSSVQ